MSQPSEHQPGEHQPYVPDGQTLAELTPKAIALGVVFGMIFGAATVYLALKAGPDGLGVDPDRGAGDLGVQAPRLVDDPREQHRPDHRLGRRVDRRRRRLHAARLPVPGLRPATGRSVGEPYFSYWTILTLALVGGVLGVLMMIPLRRSLIVKEHGNAALSRGHGLRARC